VIDPVVVVVVVVAVVVHGDHVLLEIVLLGARLVAERALELGLDTALVGQVPVHRVLSRVLPPAVVRAPERGQPAVRDDTGSSRCLDTRGEKQIFFSDSLPTTTGVSEEDARVSY